MSAIFVFETVHIIAYYPRIQLIYIRLSNKIEVFRYRFVDGQVVLYDKIDTAFTYLNKETDLFKVVNVPMIDDLKEYCELASKTANEQKEYFTGPLGNDVFSMFAYALGYIHSYITYKLWKEG